MVLFQSDIDSQHVYIDYTTSNKSFLRVAEIYKRMGIKNNAFMLALYNRELVGVDPYDPNLTLQQVAMIAYECKLNYWYYIREVLRVPSQGVTAVPYEANRANIALSWMYLNSIDSFLVLPRQIGKTITTMGLYSWLMYIVGFNTTFGLFARGNKLVIENVGRLKKMRDSLPKYLVDKRPADTENKDDFPIQLSEQNIKRLSHRKINRQQWIKLVENLLQVNTLMNFHITQTMISVIQPQPRHQMPQYNKLKQLESQLLSL